jgi:hypothetical protein
MLILTLLNPEEDGIWIITKRMEAGYAEHLKAIA